MIHSSLVVGKPLCGPVLGTLLTNYSCNLACGMCGLADTGSDLRRAGRRDLGTGRMKELIDEFAALGTLGIGFTGGEPLLRRDIFELLAHTRERGMLTHLNSNGTLVSAQVARNIVETGVDSLNISLDGATARTHDAIRGVPGAFASAIAAIKMVLKARRRPGVAPRVKIVAVLGVRNSGEVGGIARLAGELGVDCVEFIAEQPFRCGGHCEGTAPVPVVPAASAAAGSIAALIGGVPLENSTRMLSLIESTLHGLPSPVSCSASFHSLAVDCFGDLFPCLPWLNWRRPAANLADVTLREFWYGRRFDELRREVRGCRACTLNCQAELNLLFDLKPLPRVRAVAP